MCIWNVDENNRRCEFCSYRGGCEEYPLGRNIDDRAPEWLSAMNRVIGEDVRVSSRKKNVLWGRNFLAYKAKIEGLTLSQIGRLIGRDHATGLFASRRGEDAINNPQMYSDVMGIWDRFQKMLFLEKI